ncbi:MAG: hypothetical protein AAF170_04325 [Bacteroidota bacterium]
MPKRRPTNTDRAEALLHAAVHGDEAACERYCCTARSLRNWRERARDPESELSAVFRRYSAAIQEATGNEEAATDERASSFAAYIEGQVRKASDIIVEKAREINAANPESIRAVNDHVATLLGHAAALQYIASLFGGERDHAEAEVET